MIIAAWDSSTTAILVGIAGGIVGVVGPAVVALYSKWSSAAAKAEYDRIDQALQWERQQRITDRKQLEERLWYIEQTLRECEKNCSRWQTLYESVVKSSPTKSDAE